jgi:hypothetical protein
MNACFCNGIQNPPTWRVFLLEWVAVLRVEWVAGLVSLQVEGFDRYVWLSWGGIRILAFGIDGVAKLRNLHCHFHGYAGERGLVGQAVD